MQYFQKINQLKINMKRYILFLSCLLVFMNCRFAVAESTLVKIARADSKDAVQIFFSFDTLPKFSHKVSSKRIDVILEDTSASQELQLFEPDDRIIKILPATTPGKSIVSFFFRYTPQNIKIETSQDGKVVLEVLLGNRHSRSYQELSERLKGLTVVEQQQADVANPLHSSSYAHDWRSFFRDYEPEIEISVPMEFTIPPFPIIALIPPGLGDNAKILPAELQQLAEEKLWNDMLPILLEQLKSTADVGNQKLLALTHGEALLRNNDYTGAYKQLYLLQKEYPGEHVGILSQYLLTLLDAIFRDPYLADSDLKKLEDTITPSYPLAPYFILSRIETALVTKQYDRARQLLAEDNIPFPENAQKLRELRRGDYYNATHQLVKSYVSYELLRDTPLLQARPFSLNGYCDTLYRQKKYDLAAECYRKLAPQVSASIPLGLISYRTSMAELHFKPGAELIDSFARIEDAFPDTEAASRAAIKQTDLKFLADSNWAKQAAAQYNSLAGTSVLRATVAEASLKEAMVFSLMGEQNKSIELLMTFLRDFRISSLRETAFALLIDILPGEIERLIKDGKYMEALVLAKQNRELFQNNWLDVNVLADIASAYQKVGIFSEAQRVYLYLIEVADADKREKIFLPLIQSVFDQGEYSMVEDFASQYSYNYPEGKDAQTILVIRIKALIATNNFEAARGLLPKPLPATPELRFLAAEIHYHDESYKDVLEDLNIKVPAESELPEDIRFMLAESRYQLADFPGAEAIFPALIDNKRFGQQSLYRLAQIERSRGNEQNALKYFERIVEKGDDSLWKGYAERELEFARLKNSINTLIDG